jgi:hypothetical protein
MRASERLLLLAHPRSGSSNLYEILHMHPGLKICMEPFNENFVRWAPGNKDYRALVHDLASLEAVLAEVFTEFNGLKLLSYQLPEEWVAGLIRRPDFRVLFLRRRNLLQAVVSVLIAEQTGLWHRWDMDRPFGSYYAELRPLDIEEVRTRVRDLSEHLQRLDAVIGRRADGRIHKIVYEELFFAEPAEQNRAVEALWAFLDLDSITSDRIAYFLRPERSKLNSPATYRLVPNADEIEDECGDDTTGHLFEDFSHGAINIRMIRLNERHDTQARARSTRGATSA